MTVVTKRKRECSRTGNRTDDLVGERTGTEPLIKKGQLSEDQQVTRTRTREQNKPLTRTQTEQRRNDAF